MSGRDELKQLFKLLRTNEDSLIDAYLSTGGVFDEDAASPNTMDKLLATRVLHQPAVNEPLRLSREISKLFDRVLLNTRRSEADADIGQFYQSIESDVQNYNKAVDRHSTKDREHYLGEIEWRVEEICQSLLDRSNRLWQKIHNEFGYVTTLEAKVAENKNALEQAQGLNNSLELIQVGELAELAGHDPQLRRYFFSWLLETKDKCRKETSDAIHALKELLFEFRKRERMGILIDSFYRKFNGTSEYTPIDYTAMAPIPQVFNQAVPLQLSGHADLSDPAQEEVLLEIIPRLRKTPPEIEQTATTEPVTVQQEPEQDTPLIPPLARAVTAYFEYSTETTEPVSAVRFHREHHIEDAPDIWLYAIINRHDNLPVSQQKHFTIRYREEEDVIFNGRRIIHDIEILFQ